MTDGKSGRYGRSRKSVDRTRVDRRSFLKHFAGAAAITGALARTAAAEDAAVDALIGDTQHGRFGQDFDQASRNIHMPKASAPTLSPATAEHTEQAVATYD